MQPQWRSQSGTAPRRFVAQWPPPATKPAPQPCQTQKIRLQRPALIMFQSGSFASISINTHSRSQLMDRILAKLLPFHSFRPFAGFPAPVPFSFRASKMYSVQVLFYLLCAPLVLGNVVELPIFADVDSFSTALHARQSELRQEHAVLQNPLGSTDIHKRSKPVTVSTRVLRYRQLICVEKGLHELNLQDKYDDRDPTSTVLHGYRYCSKLCPRRFCKNEPPICI